MASRKNNFFEFWRSQKERGALLRNVDKLRLDPSQQRRLLCDSGVRSELQKARMASLLPPVGTEVFRRLTPASLEKEQRGHAAEESKQANSREVAEKPAVHLEAGKPLPFVYGDPPPEFRNTPLEDLDPFYQSQKTFIVLAKGNIIHRYNAESSCYLLSPFSKVRTASIKILLHPWFHFFLMVTILANVLFGWAAQYVFTAIYMFEVLMKVVSRGFFHGHFTFLRDQWNWLDIMIIIAGSLRILAKIVKLGSWVSVINTVSISLKMIAVYPGVRMTAGGLIRSAKKLIGVLVLLIFGLSVLAVNAQQLFMGNMRQKCVLMPFSSNMTDTSFTRNHGNDTGTSNFNFQKHINDPANYYYPPGHFDPLLCGNRSVAGMCPEGYTCLNAGENPNYGFTSFDSFGWSLLSMFRLMTQDFWESLLQMVLRTAGKTYVIFFMLVFFPGCFFLLSLVLAVVVVAFVEQDEANVRDAKWKEEEFVQILQIMKRGEKEEEQRSDRAEISDKQDSAPQKKRSAAEIKTHKQEHTVVAESKQDGSSCSLCWYEFANLFLKWNCCGCWRWLKQRLQTFVMNPFFDLGIVICIIINTMFMAMWSYPITINLDLIVATANLVFTTIFILEMILRLLAMDPYGYFKVGWNIFDFIIIMGSTVDLLLADVVGTSFLGLFVVLRILRLARWWPTFNLWMKIVWTSASTLKNLTFIMFIMIFMFSAVGSQLFEDDYIFKIDRKIARWHMQDSFHAFLVVVRILCGEWIETLWDCMFICGPTRCLIFYLIVLVIGNLLILNLFLALLLSSLRGEYLVPEENGKNNVQVAINKITKAMGRTRSCMDPAVDSKKDEECVVLNVVTSDQNVRPCRAPIADTEVEFKTPENGKEEKKQQCDDKQKDPEDQQNKDDEHHKGNTPGACCCDRACLFITQHKYFEIFIIFIILLSSVALVFEDINLYQNQQIQMVLEMADQVFACLFLLEMVFKWMGLGLKKYFSSFWCWIDFLILAVSLMAITAGTLGYTELGAGLSLRTVRTLRPLRALSRFSGPKLVLEGIAVTIRSMCNVLLVILVVWLFFNINGVELFAGKFLYCYNETAETIYSSYDVNNKTECLTLIIENFTEVHWKNLKINFDDVGGGYLALLQVATFKGWLDIMYSAVDSRTVEGQPDYEANLYMYLYFLFFLFFGCFFTSSLFFRVFVNTLDLQRHKICLYMTDS